MKLVELTEKRYKPIAKQHWVSVMRLTCKLTLDNGHNLCTLRKIITLKNIVEQIKNKNPIERNPSI